MTEEELFALASLVNVEAVQMAAQNKSEELQGCYPSFTVGEYLEVGFYTRKHENINSRNRT